MVGTRRFCAGLRVSCWRVGNRRGTRPKQAAFASGGDRTQPPVCRFPLERLLPPSLGAGSLGVMAGALPLSTMGVTVVPVPPVALRGEAAWKASSCAGMGYRGGLGLFPQPPLWFGVPIQCRGPPWPPAQAPAVSASPEGAAGGQRVSGCTAKAGGDRRWQNSERAECDAGIAAGFWFLTSQGMLSQTGL